MRLIMQGTKKEVTTMKQALIATTVCLLLLGAMAGVAAVLAMIP